MPATKSDNMLSSLRLGVIERLARSFWAGTLPEDVDRIPLLMRPRGSEIMSRTTPSRCAPMPKRPWNARNPTGPS